MLERKRARTSLSSPRCSRTYWALEPGRTGLALETLAGSALTHVVRAAATATAILASMCRVGCPFTLAKIAVRFSLPEWPPATAAQSLEADPKGRGRAW